MSVGSYDGSIRINTEIDASGVSTGTEAIRTGLARISASAQETGDALSSTAVSVEAVGTAGAAAGVETASATARMKAGWIGLGTTVKSVGAAISAALIPLLAISAVLAVFQGAVNFGKEAISLASDLTEVQNVVDTTFGNSAIAINDFADTATEEFGLSELAAKKYSSTMGAMLKSMGFLTTESAEMSTTLAGLAGDMASFYNLDSDEAFEKLRSGISGETEPLKQLGINLSEANLKAFALSKGIKTSYSALSEQSKAMLRYEYILKATGDAQGDFAKTSDSWANQTRLLTENWKTFMSEVGKTLITVLKPLLKILNEIVSGLAWMAEKINELLHITAESTTDIGSSADSAAESENGLAESIAAVSSASQNATESFDELNIMQGKMGGGSSGILDELNTDSLGDVEGKLDKVKSKLDDIKGVVISPPEIRTPIIDPIPVPVYEPVWNLETPKVESPVFPELPVLIYEPGWNINDSLYPEMEKVFLQFDGFMVKVAEAMSTAAESVGAGVGNMKGSLETLVTDGAVATAAFASDLKMQVKTAAQNVMINVYTMASNAYTNIAAWVNQSADAVSAWGFSVQSTVSVTAANIMQNVSTMATNTYQNIANWANGTAKGFAAWGTSVIESGYTAIKTFTQNFVSGLISAWDSFVSFMKSTGKAITGWFSANKDTIITGLKYAAITGAVVAGTALAIASAGTLASAATTAVTAVAGSLALAAPALASGAVIPPNSKFLAVLGDQRSGTNIEAPLDLIRQVVQEALAAAGGGGGPISVNITFTGELAAVGKALAPSVTVAQNNANRAAGKTLQTV